MDTVRTRQEIDAVDTWDLSDIFETEKQWRDTFEHVQDKVEDIETFKEEDFSDGDTLLAFLELQETVLRKISQLSTYAHLKTAEDTTDQDAQALKQQVQSLGADVNAALSFFEPAIQDLGRDTVETLYNEAEELEQYRHYFDDILREKEYTLPREQEALLGALSDVMYAGSSVYTLLTNADMEFPDVERPDGDTVQLTLNNLTRLLQEEPQDFRERVHTQFYETFKQFEHAVSDAYTNTVRTNTKMAGIRGYNSALQGSLDANNIPVTVYDTLLDTVQDNLDALHTHLQLKGEQVDGEMRMWDLYLSTTPDLETEVSYEQAQEYVLAAVEPLGEKYQEKVREAFSKRWIDVYETANKRQGAFSSGTYDDHAYIMLNWQGNIDSLYTLAHEMGHAVHRELTNEEQPFTYSNYPIFTAEIASTVNEALLTHYLLEESGDEALQVLAVDQMLDRIRSTLYRQSMFAAFEKKTHAHIESGGALTPDWLHDTYRDLKEAFCKPVKSDALIQYEWMRIPHFYNSFYVYQYATGISAAAAFKKQVLETGPEKYLAFLKSGGSDYPLDLLQEAGVDMETGAPVEAAIETYRSHLNTVT